MASTTIPPTAPVPIDAGEITVSENGVTVLVTLALKLETNDALDLCLRLLGAVGRIKRIATP